MQIIPVAEVGIDDKGRVFVRPASGDFEYVYRAAMEIYWDRANKRLSHPATEDWSPVQWFRQIVAATADEYSIELQLTDKTIWSNVSHGLRAEMEAAAIRP